MRLRERLRAPLALGFALACLAGAGTWATTGCSGWDPTSPFERNSPQVNEAIEELDSGRLESAEQILQTYLGTGPCGDAGIGLPDTVRQKPNGSFDLGLTLFHLAERYGRRFGEEEQASDTPEDPAQVEMRNIEIECALVIVKAIAADPSVPAELRARARYLAGNLEFLRKKYEQAVAEYDQALQIVPGLDEEAGGDGIGRDAAWNRAIALRRIQDKKDASQDSPDDADGSDGDDGSDAPDTGPDAPDGGEDGGEDGGPPDAGPDGSDKGDGGDQGDGGADAGGDAGADAGGDAAAPEPDPKGEKQPASPNKQQDERILDQLEEAPTYQEQEAKSRAGVRKGRVMEDK
jgi:tetratricopeptide (TPR) repeat protein